MFRSIYVLFKTGTDRKGQKDGNGVEATLNAVFLRRLQLRRPESTVQTVTKWLWFWRSHCSILRRGWKHTKARPLLMELLQRAKAPTKC